MYRFGYGLEAVGRAPSAHDTFFSLLYLSHQAELVRIIITTIGSPVSTLISLKVVLRLRFVRLAAVTDVSG